MLNRYDALTTSNKVSYQNALNASNLPFATACGSILTNYSWKEIDAANSIDQALQHDLPPQEVFFGIDVWAQNTTSLTHPRITYPEQGGGGTNTGIAVAKLASLGLSAGIFAPAWSFEHFPGCGRAIERAVWEGTALSKSIDCSCGNCSSRHPSNQQYPVSRYARRFPAGSKTFFYTNFSRAFATHGEREKEILFDGKDVHSCLGSQSILPPTMISLESDEKTTNVLFHKLEDQEGRPHLVIEAYVPLFQTDHTISDQYLPLYHFNMPADGTLQLSISYRKPSNSVDVATHFLLKFDSGSQLISVPQVPGTHVITATIGTQSGTNTNLQELGVSVNGLLPASSPCRILEILSICIKPTRSKQREGIITNILVDGREQGETHHLRLCWRFGDTNERVHGLPYSHITGSCSYFEIIVDGLELGRAYALEHILPQRLIERYKNGEMDVEVRGIGFDGQKLAQGSVRVRI